MLFPWSGVRTGNLNLMAGLDAPRVGTDTISAANGELLLVTSRGVLKKGVAHCLGAVVLT